MPIKPAFNDETRLRIVQAMKQKDSIKPDLTMLHNKTGMSIVTIKRALKKMEQMNHFEKFYPLLSAQNSGFEVLATIFMQIDSSKQNKFNEFLEFCKNEPRIISVHRIIGSGKWNLMIRSISRNLENFDTMINQPELNICGNDLVIDNIFFFSTEPIIVNNRRAQIMANIIIKRSEENKKIKKYMTPKRKKLLDCFAEGITLKPNIKQIQKLTKFHAATIKSSLKFLEDEHILKGYAPSINFKSLGVNSLIFDFFTIDFSDIKKLNELKKIIENDENIFHAGAVYGDDTHNFMIMHAYTNVEEYNLNFRQKYFNNKNILNFLKNRMTFFTTSSPLEAKGMWPSISTALLDILLKENGIEK
jgi:DNA-binding Lrp family transcriptional regulator